MMETPWETLLSACKDASEATIVAPYIKSPTLSELISKLQQTARIECFTRWNPDDLLRGSSDTLCRTIVKERGGDFYLHNRLHAKYYRFDDRVLVGSANTTSSGLSFPKPGNLEILCEPGTDFNSEAFEQNLRRQAHEVSDEEFQIWLLCPVSPELQSTTGDPFDENTIDSWKPRTRYPEYLWLSYSNREEQIPSAEQRAFARADLNTLKPPIRLDETRFNNWIRASLLAAPIVDMVKALAHEAPEKAWQQISIFWNISTRESERILSTTQNWLAYFDR